MIKYVVTYLLLLLIFSCKKENAFDCFKSNGSEITVVRYPGSFAEIEVQDNIELTVSNGSEYKVEVSAGKNIIKNISTKVTDNVLILKNNNTCNFVRGYKRKIRLHVTTPYAQKVTNNGVGPLTFSDAFTQDTLVLRVVSSGDVYVNGSFYEIRSSTHGNGDVYFNGSTQNLIIYTSGTNFIRAENFSVTGRIYISTYSIGDAYFNLNGVGLFEYLIWETGNLRCKGKAGQTVNLGPTDSRGKVIRLD